MRNLSKLRGLFILLFIINTGVLSAQNKVYQLTFNTIDNGVINSENEKYNYFDNGIYYLSDKFEKTAEFVDINKDFNIDYLVSKDKKYILATDFHDLLKPLKIEESYEKIAGFKCKKATYSAFSNKIEVWYTVDSKIKGSIYKSYMPENSLVLKVLINGGRGYILKNIKRKRIALQAYDYDNSEIVDQKQYRELLIKSRYEKLSVFDKQQINFGDEIVNPEFNILDSVYRFAGGTVVLKKIKIDKELRQNKLVFAEITNWSNGDAYDRTGSVFAIPASQVDDEKVKTIVDAYFKGLDQMPVIKDNQGRSYQGMVSDESYTVPIELVRFFTSFGVSHFNKLREINNYNWQDSVFYKQEITQVLPDEDYVWIGALIGNYDKGGHYLSLDLSFYPEWEENNKEKFIKPLVYTINSLELKGQSACRIFETDTLNLSFDLEKDLKNGNFLFTTTGHGGWGGGDEFNPKLNEIYLDGKLIYSVVPWRTDCATYRMSNPASGNFENGLSSSDLSRSNWCPATLTPPYFIPIKELAKGKHKIDIVIDQGAPEGNSASAWNLSLILVN